MKKDARHRRTDSTEPVTSSNGHAPSHHLAVLIHLGQALLAARARGENPWQRAASLTELTALGLTPPECRVLVSKELVEARNSAGLRRETVLVHADSASPLPERTLGTQARRRTRKPILALGERTRVILTDKGLAFLMNSVFCRNSRHEPPPNSSGDRPAAGGDLDFDPILPRYAIDLRELSVTGEVIVRLSVQARSLAMVLTTLQRAGWPLRVEKPLNGRPGGNDPHHLAIAAYKLNARQSLIHFRADDGALRWNWRSEDLRSHTAGLPRSVRRPVQSS
ncbi:MAG TPA: hypothetical protein VHC22_03310 [Pirellulales bacterium]|nr:hypothetical protein [Pirellulales bacterium]